MSSIAEGLKIKGEVQGSEDLRVDGEIEGRSSLPGAVVVLGPKGRVTGDIQAREVVLEGTCRGNVTARERVRIAATGKLEGDVAAERLVIEEGAQVLGRVESGPAQAHQRAAAAARPAATGVPVTASSTHPPRTVDSQA
ncbi:MAG TPA: polymer-forming cytoskeletal protein [Candidatus Dormibacteraeota bacterium]|nr:polymer-forming cytoskeletal protein [Candidatus Dormibacteraeota bacterium]